MTSSANHLRNETSPYLLMHSKNPVDWYPWGEEALEKARSENKLLIISVGYAACHWCHVMERESFEDEQVAEIMNANFVSIKVDREERPDIDQVYMNAAHLLTRSGGWPLNAVALPDGRPFFAGTYFPKDVWMKILLQIHQLYTDNNSLLLEQAESLTRGIRTSSIMEWEPSETPFNQGVLDQMVESWMEHIDFKYGGEQRAPKFPIPIGYRFLLAYHYFTRHAESLRAVTVTLDRMAMGGIYDQAGGGFSRYSTDTHWKVPHFEKMLYDNAQLVSLYTYAYQATHSQLYKTVVYETLEFIERELTLNDVPGGGCGFYSSLDADSEGEEGKFYLWTAKELQETLGPLASMAMNYYNATDKGNWENGSNILYRVKTDEAFAVSQGMDIYELDKRIAEIKEQLKEVRATRLRPALDDKILTSWNALMLTGYVDAYRVFGEERFLERALKNAHFIIHNMMMPDGRLNRNYKNEKSTINGFLDDYAFTIEAFITLYQATFDEDWLQRAREMTDYTLSHFYNPTGQIFYYTSDIDPALIARQMEISDNVIPSSNSRMAINLFIVGTYYADEKYISIAREMMKRIEPHLAAGGSFYSNWGMLMTYFVYSPVEIAIVGKEWKQKSRELDKHFLPGIILMGDKMGKTGEFLPLLEGKWKDGQTFIYVCRDKVCMHPETSVDAILSLLLNRK